MERFRKLWASIRSRVINGLLIAGLILVTVLLILPDFLAGLVMSTPILVRLLILGFLYIPVVVPLYRLFQQRRGKKTTTVQPPAETINDTIQELPRLDVAKPSKEVHNDVNVDNEDEFYSMLNSMSNEESNQQD